MRVSPWRPGDDLECEVPRVLMFYDLGPLNMTVKDLIRIFKGAVSKAKMSLDLPLLTS